MSKMFWAAAAVAIGVAGSFAPASADDSRMQAWDHSSNYSGGYNDGGLGRYCPPGLYPHSWPTGTGIRCQAPDGSFVGGPF